MADIKEYKSLINLQEFMMNHYKFKISKKGSTHNNPKLEDKAGEIYLPYKNKENGQWYYGQPIGSQVKGGKSIIDLIMERENLTLKDYDKIATICDNYLGSPQKKIEKVSHLKKLSKLPEDMLMVSTS